MTLDNKTVLSSLKERVAVLTEQLNDLTVQRTKCIGAIEVLTQIEESMAKMASPFSGPIPLTNRSFK